ncbi:RNA recognition motif domain-containing protein [Ditylenchus destructor]|uniref:RNA recognition motif domain-containing protein n=1 Tax=Ditylenchus destructor TaxID=166010 RepID=A0AAD4MUK5_9BILA|nr:RNA recognition motif domain-containing protein [Ditylenchus destructor]
MTANSYGYGRNERDSTGNYNPRVHYSVALNAGFELKSIEHQPKTIYIGNLAHAVTEEFVGALFGQIGTINKLTIISDGISNPYAFVEFSDHIFAAQAVQAMDKRRLMDQEMKITWVTEPSSQLKVDTSNHFHIFVGDLSPEVDNKALQTAFAPFGEISDIKVIRDPVTLKSKGYGFISFPRRENAECAIERMNGQWIGGRAVRTNWASRKSAMDTYYGKPSSEAISNQTSPANTSVYIGGVPVNCTEAHIRKEFSKFGTIVDVRSFKQQSYAFVRFTNKESAVNAITEMNGSSLMGQTIRCSWGKSEGGSGRADLLSYQDSLGSVNSSGLASDATNMQYYLNFYQKYYANDPELQQQWQK